MDTPDNTPDKKEPIYKKKWFIPTVLGGATLVLGGIYVSGLNQDSPDPTGEPTVSVTAAPTTTSTENPSNLTTVDEQVNTPTEVSSEQAQVEQTEVEKAAQNFISLVKEGDKNGEEWADHLKNLVSSSMYESMKHSGSAVIPSGAEKAQVEKDGSDLRWVAKAQDAAGRTLWTFRLEGVNVEQNEQILLVTQIDDLPTNEGQKDERGYSIATAPQPLNTSQVEAMELEAYYAAKAYLEYEEGDTEDERKEFLKAKLPGGFPELRPTPDGAGYDIQVYAPSRANLMDTRLGVEIPQGQIALDFNIAYADAAFEPVKNIEEVGLRVFFKFNEATGLWSADSMELVSTRPFF